MTPVPDRAKVIEAMARELRAARFDPAELARVYARSAPYARKGEQQCLIH